ncbi:MAG: hypothetical protein KDG89_17290 [Geminicoccaceae bacterium]|nr:hypothetical protein [Geminicoccaceae bacterium]
MTYDHDAAAPDATAAPHACPDADPTPAAGTLVLPPATALETVRGALPDNWPTLGALHGLFGDALVPVTPPGCHLSPRSSLKADDRGKVPGRLRQDGWVGLDMNKFTMTPDLLRRVGHWRANVGVKSAKFPAFDIDIDDLDRADLVEALVALGRGAVAPSGLCPPRRTGNAPKTLSVPNARSTASRYGLCPSVVSWTRVLRRSRRSSIRV